jgi:hypothetical protein
MIDRETGALVLPAGRIDRGLTLGAFERSPLGRACKRNDVGTGWVHFDLPNQTGGKRTFGVRVSFERERLDGFTLWLVDPRFGTSWDDASEEKELARRDAHDAWLGEMLGAARDFPWGEVWSTYDARDMSSTIGVRFRR